MRDLRIAATRSTFGVSLRADGQLELSGSSYPENSLEFFAPVLDWVRALLATTPSAVALTLRVEYMNTSSTKRVLDLLDLLDQHHRAGHRARVMWVHAEGDAEMREMGEDLADGLALPFDLVPAAGA